MATFEGSAVQTKVTATGPFFRGDPSKTYLGNVRRMLEEIAEEGEGLVKAQYPVLTWAGQSGVVGRVKSLSGRKWYQTAVISEQHVYPWPGGGAKQYRGGKTEARQHMFADATRSLRSSRAVRAANLAKGIE